MKRQLIAITAVSALLASMAAVSPQPPVDKTPIVPTIPGTSRDDDSKVFLEHADQLSATQFTDYQVLTGNVAFRRNGMYMWCDSAHFYDATGSFDAFGNVRMEQGDTLFIYGDTLHYNELNKLATLVATPGKNVRLINRDVTLTTEIFNYDLTLDLGYYDIGGTLTDKQNRLTSLEGEYSPTTKEAVFRENVNLRSLAKNDTLRISSDNLYYNTLTHVALLVAPSTVVNKDGTILTSNGVYNTETTQSELYDRSTVIYRNGNTLTGDTLYYNRQTGLGEAFGNVEINDTTNHTLLLGNYGYAYEPLDSAYVTGRAMAVEYSSADTLYLHGDTIKVHRIINKWMESVPLPMDSTAIGVDSIATDVTDSIAITIDSISITTDSIASFAIVSILASSDTIPEIDHVVIINEMMIERIDTIRFLVASPRVKFYRRDMQGLCDSMTIVSTDSTLYMDRFPVVWSENRQITGQQIKLHFNDSTADNATVTNNAFMAQFIEDGYFNQLAGKEMFAILDNGSLKHLDVNGNVQTIFFPEESDSTINKMMALESSFLAADFANDTITRMKIWPQTNALITPLYLAKKSQMFLQQFRWMESLRPTSKDDIFEFSPELIEAFKTAPILTQESKPWNKKTAETSSATPNRTSESSTPPPATSSQPKLSPTTLKQEDSNISISSTPGISSPEENTTP